MYPNSQTFFSQEKAFTAGEGSIMARSFVRDDPSCRDGVCSADPISELTMAQEILILCYVSGQIDPKEWQNILDDDPDLAYHFSMMWPNAR